MYHYAPLDLLTAAPQASAAAHAAVPAFRPIPELLSFVVDPGDLCLQEFRQAREIHSAASCPIYSFCGPEYVNARSGTREVAGWVL